MLFQSRGGRISQNPSHVPETEQKLPKEKIMDNLEAKSLVDKELELSTYAFSDYTLEVSPIGGFIKSVKLPKYKNEELLYRNFLYLPEFSEVEFKITKRSNGLTFSAEKDGVRVEKNVEFIGPYLWEVTIQLPAELSRPLILFEQAREKNQFYRRYQEIFYKKGPIVRESWGGIKSVTLSSPPLIGARDKYFTAVITGPAEGVYEIGRDDNMVEIGLVSSNSGNIFQSKFFVGPQRHDVLTEYGLEKIINYGFFNGIAVLIIKVLSFFVSILKNWGLSIMVLSLLIYMVLFPLTAKSTKSMRKMQEQMRDFQPKINELRKKYKDNPQKLNKEMMDLYKKHNINPLGSLGGCLPMFLQIPIFIALFHVLNRLVEIKGESFLWISDLSQPDKLIPLPFSLPFLGDAINILPLLTAGIMFLQQKLTMPQTQGSEQQKMMGFIMPIVFAFIFYRFPAGYVLYWVTYYILTFLYQLKLARVRKLT